MLAILIHYMDESGLSLLSLLYGHLWGTLLMLAILIHYMD